MSRSTIDFGIDLGTTNSAIAVLNGVTTEVIKNTRDGAESEITPSAVSIDRRGNIQVGQRARNRLIDTPDDAYGEFKRRMGTDHVYEFRSSGQSRRPEDLSAEILKSLRGDVQQRTGELVEACVVTVPAAFELHQCDATRKAAQTAGFKSSPLLQEPVAAALAYGFQADRDKSYWLVYDFGGGTFDAAIIKAEDGTLHVVNHGGDNFLGGSDMDWAIVEQIVVPRLLEEYSLREFTRGNRRWSQAFAKLKRSVEIAKIDLSRSERTTLETCKFAVGSGEDIEFDCELTRGELLSAAEPIILRSAEICKRVLKEKKLGPDAIEKVILVGGPTLAPYFRESLAKSLGIALDHSVDPLTVVARGAAVFAATQRFNDAPTVALSTGEYKIDIRHKPVGMDSAPMAGGKVSGPSTQDFSNFTLELVNSKTQWRSGKIALRPDGVFFASLHAEGGQRNIYAIELCDPSGRKLKTTPDSLTYTIGAVVEEQPLCHSMGIALGGENNEYDRLFEKGRGLPLKVTRDYRTIHPIKQGQSADVLKIPVIEGDNERADRNRLVGTLEIRGESIRRDLPAGSEVEVTLRIDESRIITVNAYVPLLDEEFETKVTMKQSDPNPEVLKREFEAELQRFQEVKATAATAEGRSAQKLIQDVEASALIQEVKESVGAAKADPDAAAKGEKRLVELKLKIDEAADALEWPALVAKTRTEFEDLQSVVGRNGSPDQKAKAAELAGEIDDIIAERQLDRLRKKLEQVLRLYWEIAFAQPGFWVNQFQTMESEQPRMTDQMRAARLLDQGRDCITKNNFTGLQSIVRQLWDLLPKEIVAAAQRGYQSGLAR
ncbi:MAG TPA: Hsp70 family protein [Thermoanaerobaculia bacterium]|nr:Hsp70 family protein [Thermoanaerobaculia bacterium]